MKAIRYEAYGNPEVMSCVEIEKPICGANEILVKIMASSLNKADEIVLTGKPAIARLMFGAPFKPKHQILGVEASGVVEAVGSDITGFAPGDHVTGELSNYHFGAFAEYAVFPPNALVKVNKDLPFDALASLPVAATTALRCINGSDIKPNERVLVTGASGNVGIFAVQLAKLKGAHVTASCSKSKAEMVLSLGADAVVDYKTTPEIKLTDKFDVIINTAMYHPVGTYRHLLTPKGRHMLIGGDMKLFIPAMITSGLRSRKNGIQVRPVPAETSVEQMKTMVDMLADKSIKVPTDSHWPLEDAQGAMKHFMSRKAVGKIIIKVADI